MLEISLLICKQENIFSMKISHVLWDWGMKPVELRLDRPLVMMVYLRLGCFTALSLSIVPGLSQQEDSQSGFKSETLEVEFMGLEKAAGMFRVPPALVVIPEFQDLKF